MEGVEEIRGKSGTLAFVMRSTIEPSSTAFVTAPDASMQVGYIVKSEQDGVPRHFHQPVQRELTSTSEFLYVKRGRCRIEIYDDDLSSVGSRELENGDAILFLAGGHGLTMLEPTVFIEVKQGPYPGLDEKQQF